MGTQIIGTEHYFDYRKGTWTPWGKADYTHVYACGIIKYSTPGHGGFHLSIGRQKEMNPILRLDNGGWYEEDCDYARVVLAFPQFFDEEHRVSAKDTLKTWAPDTYESFFKEIIPEGESLKKDEKLFKVRNFDNFVVYSASGDWHEKSKSGFDYCLARKESTGEEIEVLIPDAEYSTRTRNGFVITDPSLYEGVK